jgi:hypothetical protein
MLTLLTTLNRKKSASPYGRRSVVEQMESRTLLSVSLIQPIGNVTFAQDSGAESADLNGVFFDTNGQADLTFAATSSNPSVVSASISGSTINLTPEPGRSGFAIVRTTAMAPGGFSGSNSFRVQITASQTRTLHVALGPTRKSLDFAMSNQASAALMLKGPGTADIVMGGDGLKLVGASLHGANQELESITVSGTTAASSLIITGHGGSRFALNIGNISSTGPLGTLQIKGATLVGDVSVPMGLHKLDIDSAQSGSIDAGSSPTTIRGLSFFDENFSSTGLVRTLTIGQWADSDSAPEIFSAAAVGRIRSGGNFTPGLQLTGTLGPASIRGGIGGTWNVGQASTLIVDSVAPDWNATFGSLSTLDVKGVLQGTITTSKLNTLRVSSIYFATINLTAPNATDLGRMTGGKLMYFHILAAGSIGRIMASELLDSTVFAGIGPLASGQGLPLTESDFVTAESIGSIRLTGRGKSVGFATSVIAATDIGSLMLGTTRTDDGGLRFGVAAREIGILSVRDTTHPQTIVLRSVRDPATLAAQLAQQKLHLGDLVFRII